MAANPSKSTFLKGRFSQGVFNYTFVGNVTTRMAMPWTWLFLKLGLTPNAVSCLSMLAAVAGAPFVALGTTWSALVGGGLFILSLVWDHSDGQVARATKTGSLKGGLLDTILDRWIEFLWVVALAIGCITNDRTLVDLPAWAMVAIAAWAVHAQMYVRWSSLQHDLYRLQKELRAAPRNPLDHTIVVDARPLPAKPDLVRAWSPIEFNRDTMLWTLFVVTVTPWWEVGLLGFALLYTAQALRRNTLTFIAMDSKEVVAVRALLGPDYHK